MSWATRRCERLAHKVLGSNRLFGAGEKVVVGVSGGADSLCLLHLLDSMNRKGGFRWTLHPIHIDPGFDNWNSARVAGICRAIGVDCEVAKLDMAEGGKQPRHESCYSCARERRKALFACCAGLGSRRLALAHNLDDVNETFLLNLLYTSSARTILPAQPLFGGRAAIVRPLYYVGRELVRRYLKSVGLRPARNRCPFERSSSRRAVRTFLNRLYAEDPRIRTNLFAALHNIKPEYLPRPKSSVAAHNREPPVLRAREKAARRPPHSPMRI
jgi:tRNA 2-thiocytidine biosynthesis protein TtcA